VGTPLLRPGLLPRVLAIKGFRFHALHADDAAAAYQLALVSGARGAVQRRRARSSESPPPPSSQIGQHGGIGDQNRLVPAIASSADAAIASSAN
jgi:hypothetical protein